MKPEAEQWVKTAEQHLGAAKVLLRASFPSAAVYWCQMAIEVLLKAMWIETRPDLYERTHNLPYLAQELKLQLSQGQEEFLRKLYWQVIPTRYPEGGAPDEAAANWYYEESERMFSWLHQQLT